MNGAQACVVAVAAVLLTILGIVWINTPGPDSSTPTPSVSDGLSVERVRVGNRDLWCVRNYNGGVWCDGTQDAS